MLPVIGKTYLFLLIVREVRPYVRRSLMEKILLKFSSKKTRSWQIKQGDRELSEYYMEKVALWQEINFLFKGAMRMPR